MRAIVLAGIGALVAGLFSYIPASAAPGAVYPTSVSLHRSTTGDQFVVGAGETIVVYSSVSLNSYNYFTSNPITASTTFSIAAPVFTGLTAASTAYQWSSSGSSCASGSGTSSSLTVSATCTTYVYGHVSTTFSNTTSSAVTVTFDDSAAGISRDGTATGESMSTYAYKQYSGSTTSFAVTADDDSVSLNVYACLSSSTLSTLDVGEVLDVTFTATKDGVAITQVDGDDMNNNAGAGELGITGNYSGSAFEFTVPSGRTTSTQIMRYGYISSPAAGTYAVSMEVRDQDGNLVAESCSYGGGSALTYPTSVSAHDSSETFLPFSQTSKTIRTGVASLVTARSGDDGNGGKI